MNEDMEKKLDQLLADMPKRTYDLDAWLNEDETAAFDRMVRERGGLVVPSGFAAGSSGKTARNKRRRMWRWVAVAACFLAVVGVGMYYQSGENPRPIAQSVSPISQSVSPTTQSVSPTTQSVSPINQSVRTNQSLGTHQSVNRCASVSQKLRVGQSKVARQSVKSCASIEQPTVAGDPNVHYAALTETDDTVKYQDPSRVDDFIAELAEYYKVKAVPLACASEAGDSTVVSSAYLFKDSQELDLFARLLQVACWYNTKTPGYFLNFSQKQFLFCLKDLQEDEKYLWMAERIGRDYVLLFSTRSPKDVTLSSDCYQAYREQLTHQGINMLNF